MNNARSLLKDWRVIVMLLAIVVAFLAIQPNILNVTGAQVIYLSTNSYLGNLSAIGSTTLTTGSIITSINGVHIGSAQQFYSVLNQTAKINATLTMTYENELFPYIYTTASVTIPITKTAPLNSSFIQTEDVPSTSLSYGLDIVGGTDITVVPNSTRPANSTVINNLDTVLQTRLNTFGLSGISVSVIQTLSQGSYIEISMPNVGESQALSLIQSQGIFYATVGNYTVFNSTNKSEGIVTVCLTSSCPYGGETLPTLSGGSYTFNFGIQLTKQAAANFAAATKNLSVSGTSLSKPIVLYLNSKQISSLSISPSLKGQAAQTITISGSASSYQQALTQMKTLQSVFESGSLPTPIKVISIQSVSSTTGSQFIGEIYILLFAAFVAVALVVFLRYKDYRISSLI